ncbi:hypothetical protein M8J75_002209 [Diaphorina citri]|nr:hypothetical protein M8J75_002209 [Diaphorina citri]
MSGEKGSSSVKYEDTEAEQNSAEGFRLGFPYPTLYPYPQSYYEQEPAYPRDTDGTKDNVMTDLDSKTSSMDNSTPPTSGSQIPSYDAYCNYLQSFFTPLEPFSNPYLNGFVERPVSPMADDYTIEDLSNKPAPSREQDPLDPNPLSFTDIGPGTLAPFDQESPLPKSTNGYMCDICKEGFKSAKALNSHRATIHVEDGNDRMFQCKFCTKKFNTPGHLARHEERHFQRINMSCFLCETHFKTVNNLKFHLFSSHILSTAHTSIFEISIEPIMEPIFYQSTFIQLEMEGSVDDDHLKINVKGKLSDHLKLYNSHFNSLKATPFVQVIFHKACSKIMTVARITASQFTLVLVPQAKVLTESRLVKKNNKVVAFEVDVIAKLCVFMVNTRTMVLMKDGASTVNISVMDVKIIG